MNNSPHCKKEERMRLAYLLELIKKVIKTGLLVGRTGFPLILLTSIALLFLRRYSFFLDLYVRFYSLFLLSKLPFNF